VTDDEVALRDLLAFQEAGLRRAVPGADLAHLRVRGPRGRARPFRFMQPPHTGSVTVLSALGVAAGCGTYDSPCEPLNSRSMRSLHSHASLPSRAFAPKQWAEFDEQVTFAFARDPWSRMVSCAGWNEAIDSAKSTSNRSFDENVLGFRDFVRKTITKGGRGHCTYMGNVADWTHATPPNETERRQVVDFVGRTSRLARDFEHVTDLLGLPRVDLDSLPGHCVSSCPNGQGTRSMVKWNSLAEKYRVPRVTDFYDDETRGLVADAWKDDIEIFGFRFGGE
jgi:hypothetical protein